MQKLLLILTLIALQATPLYAVEKNVSGQKLTVFAYDSTTNAPKTGDAANITAYVSKDDGTVTELGDTSATQLDATNAPGYYVFDLTQAETNANKLGFTAKSSTSNVVVLGAPPVAYTTPPNFQATAITSGGVTSADAVAISGDTTAADRLEAHLDSTIYINHTGNDATSGTAAQAAIEGAAGGTTIHLSAGTYEMTGPLEMPVGVTLEGASRRGTVLLFASGTNNGNIQAASRATVRSVTIRETVDSFTFAITTAVQDFLIESCYIDNENLEAFHIESVTGSKITVRDTKIKAKFEWGMTIIGPHLVELDDVEVWIEGNGSLVDFKGVGLSNGAKLIANNFRVLTTKYAEGGQVLRVEDTSEAYCTNCSFWDGDLHIDDATAFVQMVNCEFSRSKVTGGNNARLVDVLSPLQPSVAFRKVGVESDGDLTKVNLAAAIDTGGIAATSFASGAIDATAIADNAIDAGALASDAITAAKIAADAIGASEIATGAIDTSALASGAITAASIASDAFTAAKFASDVTTELQSGLATAANLATTNGTVNTIAGAVGGIDTAVDALSAKIGTPAVDIATDIAVKASQASVDTIDTVVDSILVDTAEIGAAGAGLTALASQSSINTIDGIIDNMFTAFESDGGVYRLTTNAVEQVVTGEVSLDPEDIEAIADAVEVDYEAIATGVWENATRTVTGGTVTASTVSDKTGYSLTTAPLDAAGTRTALGMSSANLDTQLAAKATSSALATMQGNVTSILEDTGTTLPAAIGEIEADVDLQPVLDAIGEVPTAGEIVTQLFGTTTTDSGAGKVGRALHYLLGSYSAPSVLSEDALANAPAGEGTGELPLSETGLLNFQTFFNNGNATSTKTINNVTAPKNITITAPQQP